MSDSCQGPPARIIAGDSLTFTVQEPQQQNYPSDEWTMVFQLFNSINGQSYPFPATVGENNGFDVAVTGPQTETLLPEEYQSSYVFTNIAVTTTRHTKPQRNVWVLPDQTKNLPPSKNQQTLAAMETAMTKLASGTNQSVTINGQSYSKRNFKDLQDQITFLKAAVLREQQLIQSLLGLQPGNDRIQINFVPPSVWPPYGYPFGVPYGSGGYWQ